GRKSGAVPGEKRTLNRLGGDRSSSGALRRAACWRSAHFTWSPHDRNRPPVHPHAVRLLQVATAAGSRDHGTAASLQCPAAASATEVRDLIRRNENPVLGRHQDPWQELPRFSADPKMIRLGPNL